MSTIVWLIYYFASLVCPLFLHILPAHIADSKIAIGVVINILTCDRCWNIADIACVDYVGNLVFDQIMTDWAFSFRSRDWPARYTKTLITLPAY